MVPASLCAVVVTFHPDEEVIGNLTALRPQVRHLVVVDNGSSMDEINRLRETGASLHFQLIENGANLGIATALNIGVRAAESLAAEWVFLFDQDGRVTGDFAATMLQAFTTHPTPQRLAILVPRYVDRRFGHVLQPSTAIGNHQLEVVSTAGSLMPLGIFAHAGYFADELFIDGVDTEYSLRVRALGYTVEECVAATLLHAPGTPAYRSVFGSKPFQVANYSPARRYYQERNKIWVARRYWSRFRPFLLTQFKLSLVDFIKILLAEDDKIPKVRLFLRGILDGLSEHMGPLDSR